VGKRQHAQLEARWAHVLNGLGGAVDWGDAWSAGAENQVMPASDAKLALVRDAEGCAVPQRDA